MLLNRVSKLKVKYLSNFPMDLDNVIEHMDYLLIYLNTYSINRIYIFNVYASRMSKTWRQYSGEIGIYFTHEGLKYTLPIEGEVILSEEDYGKTWILVEEDDT